MRTERRIWLAFCVIAWVMAWTSTAGAIRGEETAPSVFLIGNSLTWDTVPGRLSGDVQWHVDCGVSLPQILNKPDAPGVKDSTLWPQALRNKRYSVVTVQPFYGSNLAQDVAAISEWMKLQPQAAFVVHSGWARQGSRADEFASFTAPDQMTHSPGYMRALLQALREQHPGRQLRPTLAQNVLAVIADDIAAGRAPLQDVRELYRDDIHVTHDHGKYLMHNVMRRAVGQPFSAEGFDKLDPTWRAYLDSVLKLLAPSAHDQALVRRILAVEESADRGASVAELSDTALRQRMQELLPAITAAIPARRAALAFEEKVRQAGGKIVFSPTGPQWLYLVTGDEGVELFDVPTTVDMYNGNNPLKGKGGRNEQVTDAWLEHLAGQETLRRIDLSNCAVQGDGLKHIAALTGLREINLTLTPANDDALRHLAHLTELRSIGLASSQCTGTGFVHLKKLTKLENVNFHFTPLNDAGLEAISQVPISGRLWFAHTRFTDQGARHLAAQTTLKRCGIGSALQESSGAAVAALVNLPIEDLSLLDNQADAVGLAHAATMQGLKRLDASHAPTIQDASLPAIARLPHLEEFRLGSAQVTDTGIQALAACQSLKKLVLSGLKHVTPAGIEKLRQSRPDLAVEVQ